MTPLHIASLNGHAEVVKVLLGAEEADVNRSNQYGFIPLYFALCKGHTEVVKELLKVEEIDVSKSSFEVSNPIYAASQGGSAELVDCLLSYYSKHENLLITLHLEMKISVKVEGSEEKKEINLIDYLKENQSKEGFEFLLKRIEENKSAAASKSQDVDSQAFVQPSEKVSKANATNLSDQNRFSDFERDN